MNETNEGDTLSDAWKMRRRPLAAWIRGVGEAFRASELSFEAAADAVGSTQAEIEAAIRLDTLDDESLRIVSDADPPATTWMLLSEVPAEEIRKALEGLAGRRRGTAFESVRTVLRDLVGISPAERVTVLDAELFAAAANKADQYAVWPSTGSRPSRNVNALTGWASRRRRGQPLTPRQAGYALSLLRELVDRRVVAVPSPDGDDEVCQAIIEAVAEKTD